MFYQPWGTVQCAQMHRTRHLDRQRLPLQMTKKSTYTSQKKPVQLKWVPGTVTIRKSYCYFSRSQGVSLEHWSPKFFTTETEA